MGDRFIVKLRVRVASDSDVWMVLERGEAAIRKGEPKAGPLYYLSASDEAGRTVARATFPELRSALDAAKVEPRSCDGWLSVRKNGDWHLWGWWSRPSGPFEVDFSFGDRDRLRTESEASRVQETLEGHGYKVERGDTEVRSTDNGTDGEPQAARSEAAQSRKRRVLTYLGEHLVLTVTAVVATVVGGIILAWIGIGAASAPAPDNSPSGSKTLAAQIRSF